MSKNINMENEDALQEGYNINADESVSGQEHLNEPVSESSDTAEQLQQELAESKDKYLRLAAEFDNFRRRTAKERLELIQTAGKDVITDLLEVLDDSDRATKQMDESTDIKALKEGVGLVFNKFRNILQSKGLRPMNAVGQEFDPELHDAITEIPAPSEELRGKVIDEITKGYYLNDKIIRHAKVVVGK
ncbi:MAG: nucleotide exchange factor GrpE [Niabella sp.]